MHKKEATDKTYIVADGAGVGHSGKHPRQWSGGDSFVPTSLETPERIATLVKRGVLIDPDRNKD